MDLNWNRKRIFMKKYTLVLSLSITLLMKIQNITCFNMVIPKKKSGFLLRLQLILTNSHKTWTASKHRSQPIRRTTVLVTCWFSLGSFPSFALEGTTLPNWYGQQEVPVQDLLASMGKEERGEATSPSPPWLQVASPAPCIVSAPERQPPTPTVVLASSRIALASGIQKHHQLPSSLQPLG